MTRPTLVTISIDALRHNLQVARKQAPGSRVWAVVKANAYGHGLTNGMAGFAAADGLALLEFEGARELRQSGWNKPILMLEGAFSASDVAMACELNLSLVVHCEQQLAALADASGLRALSVYLKFNSGMNRLGFRVEPFRAAYHRLQSLTGIASLSLMTHFANSDLPGGADQALAEFTVAADGLAGERSCCNSAAVFDVSSAHHDWIRPGVMLYGATPFAGRSAASLGLKPAMRLTSKLIATQNLLAGDGVGYGWTFKAARPMRIGVVACGYADGYPRHAATGTPIVIDGVRTRTLGRVAMDMLMVDLEPVPQAQVGSEVELWGDAIAIDEVAHSAGTIGYELMCAVMPRVPMVTRA